MSAVPFKKSKFNLRFSFLNTISPSFGNIWDNMGYQPVIVNTLFLAILAKKA